MPTTFQRYKYLLYLLRVVRELEPSILISLSLYTYTSSLWKVRSGESYVSSAWLPTRSASLDKSAWHFAVNHGETDPLTGNAFWTEVEAVDIYTNDEVASIGGASTWPTPKAAWNDAATNDLWCVAYPAASAAHLDYGPIRTKNGTCSALPAEVASWCSGWTTSVHVGGLAVFPNDDPGWRCLTPQADWPPTVHGRCYSLCIDISGETNHAPPHQTLDIIILLLLPVIFDLYFILTWINSKNIFEGVAGRVPVVTKLLYFLISCGFFAAGAALLYFTGDITGMYSQVDYPGAIATAVVCIIWGIFFFNLAGEDDIKGLSKIMRPWMKAQMWMVGISSPEQAGAKHPIDSGIALCFFLADGYGSRFNNLKRITLGVVLLLILIALTAFLPESSWTAEYAKYHSFDPIQFASSQVVVIILLLTKVYQSLKAPIIKINFEVCRTTHFLDKETREPTLMDELKHLASGSKLVVEKEACYFVGDFKLVEGRPVLKDRENTQRPKGRQGLDA